ncbi:hypothetical protein NL676_000246 [Syzygium grande]|nr:hypothetical protein NL676_000246 [Syzygium grande]
MFGFSHQVPAHLLLGQDGVNTPIGYWELDPRIHTLGSSSIGNASWEEKWKTLSLQSINICLSTLESRRKEVADWRNDRWKRMDVKMDDVANVAMRYEVKPRLQCRLKGKQW